MPDLWFFAGLAMGISLAGFTAVGSFARGADSARRRAWQVKLAVREHQALARSALPARDRTVA